MTSPIALNSDLQPLSQEFTKLEERFPDLNQTTPVVSIANQVYSRVIAEDGNPQTVLNMTKDVFKVLKHEKDSSGEQIKSQMREVLDEQQSSAWTYVAVAVVACAAGFLLGKAWGEGSFGESS